MTEKGEKSTVEDKFVTKTSDFTCFLDSSEQNSPKFENHISIKILKSENKERESKINNSILYAAFGYENVTPEQAIDSFVAKSQQEYLDLRPDYLNEKQITENSGWLNFSYQLETDAEYGRNNVINYKIFCTYYTGGAHPTTSYTYMNFDPKTGEEIKLSDIFKENSEEYLTNRLTDALANKIGASSRKEIKEKGYLIFNDIYPTENFILKNDSIIFFYNAYDIAPYALGCTALGFTYEELKDIMK